MCVRIHNHFVLVLVARALCLWRKSNDSEFIEIKFPWLSIKCVDIIFWHNESFRFFFILCFSPCFYSLTLNLICLKILVKFQVLNLFFSSLFEAVCICVPCVCYYLLPHFAFDVYIDQMKIDRLIPKVMICFIQYVRFHDFFALFHLPDSTRYITFSCHLDEIHFQASSKVVHAMNPIYTKFILEKRLMCFIMIQTPWGIILIFRLKFLACSKSTEKCSSHIAKIHVAFLIVKYSHLCQTSKSFCQGMEWVLEWKMM